MRKQRIFVVIYAIYLYNPFLFISYVYLIFVCSLKSSTIACHTDEEELQKQKPRQICLIRKKNADSTKARAYIGDFTKLNIYTYVYIAK